MTRLLSAGFVRLRKDKPLWILMVFMALFGALLVNNAYDTYVRFGVEPGLGGQLFGYGQFIGILASAFSSLFLGTEYSDGTIRNKLIAGHRRITVYFSGLILNMAAAILMILSYQLSLVLLGLLILGPESLSIDSGLFIYHVLAGLALTAAYCAIFTFISMLNQKRAVVAVVSILTSFILLFGGGLVLSRLSEPEYWEGYTFTSDSGEVFDVAQEPNPYYPRGTTRKILEFLFDFLPGAQSVRLTEIGLLGWEPPVYSLAIAVAFTGSGILLFRKKDLK